MIIFGNSVPVSHAFINGPVAQMLLREDTQWVQELPSVWLFPKSTDAPLSESCLEARQESPHNSIMGLLFHVALSQLMSGDGCSMLRCFRHCLLSIESGRVVHYSQILHSCVLLTLVFGPRSAHRKHIVAMPSGRLRAWRKVYIHPNSTKLSFTRVQMHLHWPQCALWVVRLCCTLCY